MMTLFNSSSSALGLLPAWSYSPHRPSGGGKQPLNLNAIGMFFVFVLGTLAITWWAARQTQSTSTSTRPAAVSAAFRMAWRLPVTTCRRPPCQLSSLVFAKGYDGFIYTIGFFVGWPIITFLMAERLRNLGATFADIVSYRLDQNKVRSSRPSVH
jgi:cation/acetate symporter